MRALRSPTLHLARLILVASLASFIPVHAATHSGSNKKTSAVKKKSRKAVHVKTETRPPYQTQAEVIRFIDEMVSKRGFERSELEQLFAQAHYSEGVVKLMTPAIAPTGTVVKNWRVYRSRFIEPRRISAGVQFWHDHAETLTRAANEFGVPEEIIVGIIGVETIYGRNTGDFRLIDTLTTLAFDYPKTGRDRSAFFREQLEDYLLFARSNDIDLLALRGSFAGAIGMPQFMPGSYRRYGIDYDGDGHTDLLASADDAIGSVANFLVQHGWQRGLATNYPVIMPSPDTHADDIARLVDAGGEPTLTADDLKNAGLIPTSPIPPDLKLALIDLPNQSRDGSIYPTEYVLGTQNFYVITRYNRSYFYAMSVIELGTAIRNAMDPDPVPQSQ